MVIEMVEMMLWVEIWWRKVMVVGFGVEMMKLGVMGEGGGGGSYNCGGGSNLGYGGEIGWRRWKWWWI